MSGVSRAPTGPFGIFSYVLVMLSALFLFGALHAAPPVTAEETGIKGKVLREPAYPGPEIIGKPDEAPFSATFCVLDSEEEIVARFESDEKGRFKVSLPPGEYTIVPAKAPIPFPRRQRKEVTVPDDGFAEVTLKFDTGMK
jgi:hypothetical protein